MILYHKDHDCGSSCHHEQEDDIAEQDFFVKKNKTRIIPTKIENNISFPNFLNFFPPVELPYTITSDTQRLISRQNDPLSAEWMFNYVLGKEATIDEFTEFMPCFTLPETHGFYALVYWEAAIEGTAYYLVTYALSGVIIDKIKIAGTKYDEDGLLQMVCTIGEDWMISCVEGRLDAEGKTKAVEIGKTHHHTYLQLSSEGEIVAI